MAILGSVSHPPLTSPPSPIEPKTRHHILGASERLRKMADRTTIAFAVGNDEQLEIDSISVRRQQDKYIVSLPGRETPVWFRNHTVAAALIIGYQHAAIRYAVTAPAYVLIQSRE
jgi:hypothetical protein